MRVNFTLTSNNITLFYKSKVYQIPYTYHRFNDLKDHLKLPAHDESFIESIVDVPKEIERAAGGKVSIRGNVVYYENKPVHDVLTQKLLDLLDEGFEITPWINFMNNLFENPSEKSRESLFTFLEKHNTPITEDGYFIAFKRIRQDWFDIHTGRSYSNKPGSVIEMDREKVNPNNKETCSSGLHVAASPYLESFASAANNRTISVKVNPKDVVSVPVDYGNSKMRVCKYEVIDEVSIGDIKDIENKPVFVDKFDAVIEAAKEVIEKATSAIESGFVNPKTQANFSASEILAGIKSYGGITSWANAVGVARSTAQGWVQKIKNSNVEKIETAPVVETPAPEEVSENLFATKEGKSFSEKEILEGVKTHGGVTAWANSVGVARSTAQGWVKRIVSK